MVFAYANDYAVSLTSSFLLFCGKTPGDVLYLHGVRLFCVKGGDTKLWLRMEVFSAIEC